MQITYLIRYFVMIALHGLSQRIIQIDRLSALLHAFQYHPGGFPIREFRAARSNQTSGDSPCGAFARQFLYDFGIFCIKSGFQYFH